MEARSLFKIGRPIVIHHRKPWKPGRPIELRGEVASFDGRLLKVVRQFRGPGQPYDGLYATQEVGDHGTIELRRGSWVSRRRYFRRDNSLIGELYNIQTPTEFLPDAVRYLDLEIDVAYLPHHPDRVQIQDVAELERAVARGYIPNDLAIVARDIAEELARRLRESPDAPSIDWDIPSDPALLTPDATAFYQDQTKRRRLPNSRGS